MVLWGSVSQLWLCLKETMRGINVKMSKERMLINEASNVTHPMTENSFETLKKNVCVLVCSSKISSSSTSTTRYNLGGQAVIIVHDTDQLHLIWKHPEGRNTRHSL